MTVIYTDHAARQMLERDIRRGTVEYIVQRGKVIEKYPDDPRGASYLILGWSNDRPIHVVASDKDHETVVITTYEPESGRWSDDYETRQ